MGGNGSYNKTLGRVRGKSRTHQEFHHRIDGHKILLQNKNKNQVKLPMNSNSESPIYLLGKVDKKTGTLKVTTIGIYENHKCVGQIDLKFNKDGSYKPFMDGQGSHYHKFPEGSTSGEVGRVSHDPNNAYPVPSSFETLIGKLSNSIKKDTNERFRTKSTQA